MKKLKSYGEFLAEQLSKRAEQEPEAKQAAFYARLSKEYKRRLRIRKAKKKLEAAQSEYQEAQKPID